MKHILRISFIPVCAAFVVLSAVSATAASGAVRGDANKDGTVSVADVTAIQKKLAYLYVIPFDAKAADVDGNGLTISDATRIQRYLADVENPYNIGERIVDPSQPTTDKYELPFIPI